MTQYLDKEGLKTLVTEVKKAIKAGDDNNIPNSQKGVANGVATLDSGGKIPIAQLGNLDTTVAEVVASLPTTGIKKHIYMVKASSTSNQNIYKEYIYTGDTSAAYDASKWEQLGEYKAEVDLSGYLTKTDASNTYLTKYDAEITYIKDNPSITVNEAGTDFNYGKNCRISISNGGFNIDGSLRLGVMSEIDAVVSGGMMFVSNGQPGMTLIDYESITTPLLKITNATSSQLLCGDGTLAERVTEDEITQLFA